MIFDQKKFQFIYSLRSANIIDSKLLTAMENIPRKHFINNTFKEYALDDIPIPIDCGQTTTQPSIIGIMTQALQITSRSKILEIGTGSGYQTSILADLGRRVYSVERHQKLAATAKVLIEELSYANVTAIYGDGTTGLKEQAPFDRIIVSAAFDDIPKLLLSQLKTGGILVAPVGSNDRIQTLVKVEKKLNCFEYTDLKKVRFLPIVEGQEDIAIARRRTR